MVMGKCPLLIGIGLVAFFLVACDPAGERLEDGPRLVQDVTLAATTPAPTRVLSPTPSPIIIPVSTSELISPLNVPTSDVDFLVVTPTLPPSKTPTPTATMTVTRTRTSQPTWTPDFGFVPVLPTTIPGIVPIPTALDNIQPGVQSPFVQPPLQSPPAGPQNCSTPWFFVQPQLSGCPLSPAVASSGSFQQFQKGYMIWVGGQDAIYALYDSANLPRWQVFNDAFDATVPDTDPAYDAAPPYTWQPKRGFGLLWRSQPVLRDRIGWSVIEWETPYDMLVQTASDGTIYINAPRRGIFALAPGGADWKRYE